MQRRNFLKSLAISLPALKAQAAALKGEGQPLELAADGKTNYSICLSRHASPSEIHGAQELQKFLGEISGATFPIVTDADKVQGKLVLVGNSSRLERLNLDIPFKSLGTEGFMLRTSHDNLVIAGGRQRGTMYGVYTFLEKLGCRWFTEDVSRIPKLRKITVEPLDEIQKPAFEYRAPYFTEAFNGDWMARNKMNGGLSAELDDARGGSIKYYPFVHSFYALLPPKKYFKDHPEYFALVDGKRRDENAQLCLTNPEVLRIAIATVFDWIREHPEATIFSVSQNDSWGWCECDNCRRVEKEEGGAHSGPVLRFVNAVAAAVAPKYPGKLIDTLAYSYTQTAPSKTRPLPNVRIRMCPIGACEAHPYEDCRYDAYIMKDLRDWSAMTHNLYIWHYVTNFSHGLRPYPDFGELAADIPMYQRNGVVGIFLEGFVVKGGGAEKAALRSYVMARLLWDTHADVKRIIEEFHHTYYGKAAPAMLAYFNSLQRVVDLPPKGKGQHFWCCASPFFTDEFLAQADRFFAHAQAAAENDDIRVRVEKARLPLDYLELNRVKRYVVRGDRYEPVNLSETTRRYKALMSKAKRFGITDIVEQSELGSKFFPVLVKPYRYETLQNTAATLRVAPELTGRVFQMLLKPSGKNVLLEPDPTDHAYPDFRGLAVFPYGDFLDREPKLMKWELDTTPTAGEWRLLGTGDGIRCHRRIQLVDGAAQVHTETTLENTGTTSLEVTLQSQIDINPEAPTPQDMDHLYVTFRQQNGKAVDLKLIKPVEEPVGVENYMGTEQPDGELRMVNRRTGRTVITRFPKDQVARCTLNWTAKNQTRVTVAVWSKKRTLKPGESLQLDADYSANA
ncbi:MAG TPA: DUF4838 domain-containing protein [Terriglobia bacterium]|nr:DUF4838 domain-containing protein [Terriglobia bacterium]